MSSGLMLSTKSMSESSNSMPSCLQADTTQHHRLKCLALSVNAADLAVDGADVLCRGFLPPLPQGLKLSLSLSALFLALFKASRKSCTDEEAVTICPFPSTAILMLNFTSFAILLLIYFAYVFQLLYICNKI